MSELSDIESKLQSQSADYLKRLDQAGQLPTIISKEWQKAGGEETKALRGEEAKLLTDYVSAGARNREKYKDVWDPYARDRLASSQTAMSYKPIADVRSELAMRAEALGVATSNATAMYGAETNRAQTNLGFTQSAYERSLAREQEAKRVEEARIAEETRQRERAEEMALARSKAASASNDGGFGAALEAMLNRGDGTKQTESVPMIGKMPLSDLLNNVKYGSSGQVEFDTNEGIKTREEMVDKLIGTNRNSPAWQSAYGIILNNFKEQQTSPQQTEKAISSFIPIPGQNSTKLRGF